MSALEDEIIQKFQLLDKGAKERVLLQLEQVARDEPIEASEQSSTLELLEWGRKFRAEIQAKYGEREIPSIVDLLEEAREERLNDIMGGS